MPRRAALVTQADIARALRAAEQAGAEWAVEIMKDGTIRLVRADSGSRAAAPSTVPVEPEEEFVLW